MTKINIFDENKPRTLNKQIEKLNHFSAAYSLSNSCPKNSGIGQLLVKVSLKVGW